LSQVLARDRQALIQAFAKDVAASGAFDVETVRVVRRLLRDRYEGWQPEIDEEHRCDQIRFRKQLVKDVALSPLLAMLAALAAALVISLVLGALGLALYGLTWVFSREGARWMASAFETAPATAVFYLAILTGEIGSVGFVIYRPIRRWRKAKEQFMHRERHLLKILG
ncbi:MAG: hypothetical protein ACREUU_03820, partial [Gammaproteobacteria bacterium]